MFQKYVPRKARLMYMCVSVRSYICMYVYSLFNLSHIRTGDLFVEAGGKILAHLTDFN
jgi:hypothetical protein